jgi:hypothetical protein
MDSQLLTARLQPLLPHDGTLLMVDLLPPGLYFISHSYRDVSVRQALIDRLPAHARPFVFPPISVSPVEFISNALIGSLLTCDAVIVLEGGFSAQSFWVAFERNYALRIGKPVYTYTPGSEQITRNDPSTQGDLNLPVYPHGLGSYADPMMHNMWTILDFMEQQRFFSLYEGGITGVLEAGGYVVQFRGAVDPHNVVDAAMRTALLQPQPSIPMERLVLGLLADAPLPEWLRPDDVIHLYRPSDPATVDYNRVDDLIVRLYWKIYRNRHPTLVASAW